MKKYSEWLVLRETFDRSAVTTIAQERENAVQNGGTGGKSMPVSPEEIQQLEAVHEVAKKYFLPSRHNSSKIGKFSQRGENNTQANIPAS